MSEVYSVPAGNIYGTSAFSFTDGTISGGTPLRTFSFTNNPNATKMMCVTKAENGTIYSVVLASDTAGTNAKMVQDGYAYDTNYGLGRSFTYNGKTVYYAVPTDGISTSGNPLSPSLVYQNETTGTANRAMIAWVMIYGDFLTRYYNVSYNLTHVTYDGNNPTTIASNVTEETARTFTLYVDENYEIDNNTISVSNCSYEYETTGDGKTIYLHLYAPTGDVVITAAAGTDDPYSGEGDGSIGGADVGVPGLPTLGNVSAGLFSLFAPTAGQMNALADFLWTDIDFSQVISAPDQLSALNAMANIFQELGEAFKREIANPAKMIFGLSIIPSQGLAIGGAANVKIGFVDTGVAMNILTNRYFTVDCGGVSISPVCGDTFLDYAPYSKFSIYLPYIGVKPLDANDCVGHTISVKYNCDAVSGGCVCYVCKDGAVYYQYAGNIAMNLPLSSESWANTIAAAMNTASQLAAGIASGGVAGAGATALQAASNVAANPSQLSPQIDHSGAVNGAAGYLGVQYPYIIREAVRFLDTAGMNQVKGYPSHYLTKLSNLSGYTEVLECHLEGIKATENELNEIENLLKSGVII